MFETFIGQYMNGMAFIHAVHEKGWSEVEKLYREYPPESTEQILHPEKWFAREAPVAIEWPAFESAALFADWELLGENVLGESLWRGVKIFLPAAAAIFAAILAIDVGVEKYQAMRLRERASRVAALQHLALNSLRGDVQSVTDLGDGRYELTTYLQNVGGEAIYVMTPEMRAYVQVASLWQEVPMTPGDEGAAGVTKIEGKQTYRYRFDARVRDFAQLLPNYMHVRFSGSMLVSPSGAPNGDVFERKDNYYVYLKPFDVADDVVLKRMRFSGKPPVWIPMPPH